MPPLPLLVSRFYGLKVGDGVKNHRTGSPSYPLYAGHWAGSKVGGGAVGEAAPFFFTAHTPSVESGVEASCEWAKE